MTNTHFNLSRNDLCQNRLDFLGSILDPCFKSHISSFSFMSYLASSKPQQNQLSQVRLGIGLSQSSCCRLLLNCINQAPSEFLDEPNVEHIDGSPMIPLQNPICTEFVSIINPTKSTLNS